MLREKLIVYRVTQWIFVTGCTITTSSSSVSRATTHRAANVKTRANVIQSHPDTWTIGGLAFHVTEKATGRQIDRPETASQFGVEASDGWDLTTSCRQLSH